MIGLAPRPIAAAGLTVKVGADVTWYGATGDGVTDDSAAIQRAADAANNSNIPLYIPPGYTFLIGTAANPFADGLGGVKIYKGMLVYGRGRTSLLKKATGANYVLRVESVEHVEIADLAIDMACEANFQVGIHLSKADDVYVHDCLVTNSVVPGGANWTIHAVLADASSDVRWVNNRTVRCQVKLGTNGYKTLVAGNTMIGAYNQAFSWVFGGTGVESVGLTCVNNYIEGPADSGIFFGQDTGTTGGTFKDVLIANNMILGFNTNRGILGRYGSINANWSIMGNHIRGGGALSTTIASQTANTFTVQAGVGASYPTQGWIYLELGTVREEYIQYTRSGDVFTSDHNFYYTHANGSEVWGLTFTKVTNTLGIDIQSAADNTPGPMHGLRIHGNTIENVDQQAINVSGANALTDWSVVGNAMFAPCRGIAVGGSATQTWSAGLIASNVHEGFGVYSIYLISSGGAQGQVSIIGNVVNGDSTSNSVDGLRVECSGGSMKVHCVGNVFTGQAAFSESAGIFEKTSGGGTIDGFYAENDLRGNTGGSATAAVFTAAAVVRNNRGYVTEAKGTGSILSGTTSVVITHGLSVTPTAQDITITPTALSTTDPGEVYVDTITSTQFTVRCRTNPGASNLPFGWRAAVL